jgi:predicted TIM-barrel enzyme
MDVQGFAGGRFGSVRQCFAEIFAAQPGTAQEAEDLAQVGADVVVAHVGTSSAGLIGAESVMPMSEALQRVRDVEAAAHAANPEVLVLCHGGPIVGGEEAEYVMRQVPGVAGFYGASSMERIPVERAIIDNLAAFKKIPHSPPA